MTDAINSADPLVRQLLALCGMDGLHLVMWRFSLDWTKARPLLLVEGAVGSQTTREEWQDAVQLMRSREPKSVCEQPMLRWHRVLDRIHGLALMTALGCGVHAETRRVCVESRVGQLVTVTLHANGLRTQLRMAAEVLELAIPAVVAVDPGVLHDPA